MSDIDGSTSITEEKPTDSDIYNQSRICQWSYDETTEECWNGDCGVKWVFNDTGSPTDHGMNYCHGCGRPLQIAGKDCEATA